MFHLAIVLVALAYITAMAALIGLLITLIIDLITGKRLSKENKKSYKSEYPSWQELLFFVLGLLYSKMKAI
ncbi:MAG: hypothetical protein E7304_01360 [Butyrivibrio sp.]|jgi:hypothetical protein|uniref:hypothetical protein n=1 Tax=Butyrivibrio sp. TaxID=28121 RepID=UPI001EB5743A|nr:hypothetical protein [Butyrivibrio sp.]MBE5840033.1 hypothetical protein [Butyrivibrio sp.]